MWKTKQVWPASQHRSADWLRLARLEAALSLIWRWRGVSKLEGDVAEASGRLFSTWRTAAAV